MTDVKKTSPEPKRRYVSPQREQQAAATRQRLVTSARALFRERGYAATSIEAIARGAGTAVQTFYATFGSKPALLLALLETMEREAEVPRLLAELKAHPEARRQIEAFVAFSVRFYGRAADVLDVIRSAGMAEKDLGDLWKEGEGRRRRAQQSVVRGWAQRGELKPGLSAAHATDILWALTGADSYRLFVGECAWSEDRYARWLSDSLAALLLRPV